MTRYVKEWMLDNGLHVVITNESAPYYEDFWNVKVVIRGTAPVQKDQLWENGCTDECDMHALEGLGDEVTYHREIVQVGVRDHEVNEAVARHVSFFQENSLPYLAHPAFPRMMAKKRWDELVREVRARRSVVQRGDPTNR